MSNRQSCSASILLQLRVWFVAAEVGSPSFCFVGTARHKRGGFSNVFTINDQFFLG